MAGANPSSIDQISPNGKWAFHAEWLGDRGYIYEVRNKITSRSFFATPHPPENEGLPHRLNVIWSPDSRYLALNFYYGRIAFGIGVISLSTDVPSDQVTWPRAEEASMIKPDDRKSWDGSGGVNSSANNWQPGNVLSLGLSMSTELNNSTTGKKTRIDSDRKQQISFTGLKGRVIKDEPPAY